MGTSAGERSKRQKRDSTSSKRSKKGQEVKFVVVDGGGLSPEGVDRIASILFEWWRRDYEKASTEKASPK